MVELAFHDMLWCPSGGHPVLVLAVKGGEECFAVSVSAEDAQALAVVPHGGGAARVRAISMLAETITRLGAGLADVTLGFGPDNVLCADVTISTADGQFLLSAHFSDGLILARHTSAPLRMTHETFAQVDRAAFVSASSVAARGQPSPRQDDAPEPFRSFIETLDLSELNGTDRPSEDGQGR